MIEQEPADIGQDGFEFLAAVLLGIEVDTNNSQASVVIGILDLFKPWDLRGVGQAPACPEDDQDNFPFFIGEVERLAIEVGSLDGRCGLADQLDPFQTPCEEVSDGRAVRLFENEPESLTGDRELIPFDEALIVCFADSDDLAGGEACPSRSRLSFLRAFGNGLT